MPSAKKPIGRRLVENKILTEAQVQAVLQKQAAEGGLFCQKAVDMGFCVEEAVLPLLAEELKIPHVSLRDRKIAPEVIAKVPAKLAHHYLIIPLELAEGTLTVAMNDPTDTHRLDEIQMMLGARVEPQLASKKDIREALKRYYGIGAETVESMMRETEDSGLPALDTSAEAQNIETLAEDASIIKFVNQILREAYNDRATDIHVEPYEDELKIRYRIDGILYDAAIPPNIRHFQAAIVSRIKIMAHLNIAERRLPQDGRIKIKIGDEEMDLRVSILPTPYGESVVIRLLSGAARFFGLDKLGLDTAHLKALRRIITKPHGIVLLTGPTGSGKTTTLYAFLTELNKADNKIITIEDPIEYQIKGITQIQVHPKIDLTFSRGLRSMLRHDPDIMMVGEIRDLETAEITIRVALTGHLVFSTLHTNDAASAVARLVDMGVESYLVASSVECIIAQRLVRTLCPHCKETLPAPAAFAKDIAAVAKSLGRKEPLAVGQAKGCPKCKGIGYQGRTAIHEILVVDDELRSLVVQRLPANVIRDKAVAKGMRTLRQDGWRKALAGETSVDEVLRVTQENEALD